MTAVSGNWSNHTAKFQRLNIAVLVLAGALGFLSTNSYALDTLNPLSPSAMEATRVAPRDIVGDLGGVPVTIPRHFANYVEYEGDPGWGGKRQGPRPLRTHQSKLISFGYYTRFPDMAGQSSAELIEDKAGHPASKTSWISVGISTGTDYPGDQFLDRQVAAIGNSANTLKYEKYEELPAKQYGLKVYAATGMNPKTGTPHREDRDARDLFVHADKAGSVDTYINCSNRRVSAPPCEHTFSLAPHMRAKVYIVYRRSQLANWREIQEAVSRQILGFKAVSAATSAKP